LRDSCAPSAGIIFIQQPTPGVILPPGFHPITIIASDSCGNVDSCLIDLMVICDTLCCKDSLSLDSMIYAVFDSAIINCDTLCLKPIPDTCQLHWMVDWGNGNNTPWDGVSDSICQVYNNAIPTDYTVCITVFELNDDGETCRTQTICDTFMMKICEPPIEPSPFLKLAGDSLENHYTRIHQVGNFLYAAGYRGTGANRFAIFSQYDLSGTLNWTTQLNAASSFTDFVEVDATGNDFLLVGRTEPVNIGGNWQDNESLLCRIDKIGNLVWSRNYLQTGREAFTRIVRMPNPTNPQFGRIGSF